MESLTSRFTGDRIAGLDIARALAIIGMMAAHTIDYPSPVSLTEPASWAGLVSGRPSLLFALLGGISIALMTGKTSPPSLEDTPRTRLSLTGRALAIFLIGLVLEQLGTNISVILTFYAVLYFIIMPFLRLRPLALLGWAAGFAVLGPIGLALLDALLPAAGPGNNLVFPPSYNLPAWLSLMLAGLALGRLIADWKSWPTALALVGGGSLLAAIGYGVGTLYDFNSSDLSDSVSSSSTSSMSHKKEILRIDTPSETTDISGAANKDLSNYSCTSYKEFLLCQTESDTANSTPFAEATAVKSSIKKEEHSNHNAWPDHFASFSDIDWPQISLSSLFRASPHSGATAEIIGSGGFSLAVIGFSLLAARLTKVLLYPIAALGSMPLTAYSAHVLAIWVASGPGGIITSPVFFWFLTGGLTAFASLWLLFFSRGPLETLALKSARSFSGE